MVFRIDDFKNVCSVLSSVTDSNNISIYNDILELKMIGNQVVMCVTNKEYFVSVNLDAGNDVDPNFHATVNANLFLKLISKITTDTVEFSIDGNNLIINGNGSYKIPMIFDGEHLLTLPEIHIDNVTVNFNIDGNLLCSVYKINSKQLSSGLITKAVQKLYYIDENGAITFTTGACVNKFSLSTHVSMLLNAKLVKMFNLFKNVDVAFSMGYDSISDDVITTKVEFKSDTIKIDAIISTNDSMISSVPVTAIRDRAFKDYAYSAVVNRVELLNAVERLMLFHNSNISYRFYSKFIFYKDHLTLFDANDINTEVIYYADDINSEEYSCELDLNDVKTVLDCLSTEFITIKFGDEQAVVLSGENVYNVIPEVRLNNAE